MSELDKSTEQVILRAARKVFTLRGFDGARMQQIADEAGINKALLHYYFRSKEKLFDAIFKEVMQLIIPGAVQVLLSDLNFSEKIYGFVEKYLDSLLANPDVPGFVLHELSLHPERLLDNIKGMGVDFNLLVGQIRREIELKHIKPVEPDHFMINLVSLCMFPFLARPVLMGLTGFDHGKFNAFIAERKQEIPRLILQSILP
ncbi:MAG: TetR/AcrR family transcriptional regulator [Lentimicrobium sp.]|jgi:AcrR family transcriptional regulator|nr:TetR/AcrR family transcriptional regulator [Lentimicrobium sp.]MDD2528803.1 helix-turn-helix domain containing protein [Lentimicrobiaceae bacterium]MDD4598371.1 helix-turn-helix domain containing protein [Lentimicrobiaceae bacterium]MDY0025600.1 helix-turn-helix domain-containing protein [Lentimicrobium sp.]HAH59505.1 TetR/AcrR family transcriptional regulator [Bacteroidales bacterium]